MIDANELLCKLTAQGSGAQTQAALSRLQRALAGGQGGGLPKNIDAATAARIERAAQAAQAGDKWAAQAAVAEIMATPEGAALAAQIKRLLNS